MKNHKPAWWQLYLLVPIMASLMIVEHLVPLPGISDNFVDAGIMALIFGAMLIWIKLNAASLEETSLHGRPQEQPALKLHRYKPNSGTKGIEDSSPDHIPPGIQPLLIRSHKLRRAIRSGRDTSSH